MQAGGRVGGGVGGGSVEVGSVGGRVEAAVGEGGVGGGVVTASDEEEANSEKATHVACYVSWGEPLPLAVSSSTSVLPREDANNRRCLRSDCRV